MNINFSSNKAFERIKILIYMEFPGDARRSAPQTNIDDIANPVAENTRHLRDPSTDHEPRLLD